MRGTILRKDKIKHILKESWFLKMGFGMKISELGELISKVIIENSNSNENGIKISSGFHKITIYKGEREPDTIHTVAKLSMQSEKWLVLNGGLVKARIYEIKYATKGKNYENFCEPKLEHELSVLIEIKGVDKEEVV